MQPRVLTGLLNTALKGQAPPVELLSRAVSRNRAEGDITRPRAALMKMVLTYDRRGGEKMEKQVAYDCGRLLAELEAVQAAAIGSAGATLVDKYFGMASTTPAPAFGMLLRLSQPHLSKLRREKPGLAYLLEDRISEITSAIGADFPRTLLLRDQAVFALGFYNQRASGRAERRARWEARQNGQVEEEVS